MAISVWCAFVQLRYLLPTMTLRLTTDIPVAYIEDEIWFLLDEEVSLILHPDESLTEGPSGGRLSNTIALSWIHFPR